MRGKPLLPAKLMSVLFLVTVTCAFAQEEVAVRAFDEGNVHLAAGEFLNAIESYKRAEEVGLVSTALYHNMGVAYYRLDDLGKSILYLERAHRLDRDSDVIAHSLSVASARRQDQLSRIGIPFTKRAHQWLLRRITPRGLVFLGLAAYLGFMGILLARTLLLVDGPWWRRTRFWLGTIAAGVLLLAFYSSVYPAFDPGAVVMAKQTVLMEQPVETSTEVATVHEGLVVTLVNSADNWHLVQLPNGTRGWMPATALESI